MAGKHGKKAQESTKTCSDKFQVVPLDYPWSLCLTVSGYGAQIFAWAPTKSFVQTGVTCDKWELIQTDISCFENEIRFKLPGWIAWCITVIAIILMISSGLPQTNRYCRMISMIFLAPIKKMQPFCLHLFLISIAVGSCFSIFLNNLIKTRNSCQFDSNSFHH